jgi:hypothetical protein
MLAAYCDGCMKEIVSNDREDMVSWVAEHHDHYRTWTMAIDLIVNPDAR